MFAVSFRTQFGRLRRTRYHASCIMHIMIMHALRMRIYRCTATCWSLHAVGPCICIYDHGACLSTTTSLPFDLS